MKLFTPEERETIRFTFNFSRAVKELKYLRKDGLEKPRVLEALDLLGLETDGSENEIIMKKAIEAAYDECACVCRDCLESEYA